MGMSSGRLYELARRSCWQSSSCDSGAGNAGDALFVRAWESKRGGRRCSGSRTMWVAAGLVLAGKPHET
uniref:Uncharacterized protein n=1 Tax=Vespula pensylvanica TaxID=30213 RepID=A0A834P134_VESPE|nr:hypothetical protein H0235_009046 [Vespula pensylvanica]